MKEITQPRFSSKKALLAIRAPEGKEYVEVWHSEQAGFGCRIMAHDSQGRIRRTYICRYKKSVSDGKGGYLQRDTKERLGLVEAMGDEPAISFDEAKEAVLAKRRVLREQKTEGSTPRMTVAEAWANYATEKELNRGTSHTKDRTTYERHLQHLGSRFLDELGYPFWSQMVSSLRSGTLVVGQKMVGDEQVPDVRGPLANTSLNAVLNVAAGLYSIAHKYKGLRGLTQGENPPAQAKTLVGAVTKKKGQLPLKDVGLAWRATGQLLAPHWRDLFRVGILTGLRRGLLWTMRFDEVDFKRGLLLIDPRKPGTKRRGKDIPADPEPMLLPLSSVVLGILKERSAFAPDANGPVFYSGTGGPPVDQRKAWAKLEAVLKREIEPHDLRRTFATLAMVATKGADILAIALLMLHSGSGLAKAVGLPAITIDYMNTEEAQAPMRAAADAISTYVLTLAEENTAPDAEPDLPAILEAAAKEP